MRSEAIFRAQESVANKYNLCQVLGKASRLFNTSTTDTQEAIKLAFERLAIVSNNPIVEILSTVII